MTINVVMKTKDTLSQVHRSSNQHPENTKCRRQADEKAIQDLNITIDEWGCDPWDLENHVLRSMQSGLPASQDLRDDFKKT